MRGRRPASHPVQTGPRAQEYRHDRHHRPPPVLDEAKLMDFVFRAVDEVGATLNCALVVMGDRLGYYRALADHGPLAAPELAQRTGTGERYAREWLNAQAAGGFVTYDPATRALHPAGRARRRAHRRVSPAFLPGFFQIAFGTVRDAPRIFELARDGDGLGWGDHNNDVHDGCERFFRPGLRRQPGRRVAAGPGRRGRQARARRPGRRPRLRARRVDDPDGAGLPGVDVRRLRRARRVDRDRPGARRRGRGRRPDLASRPTPATGSPERATTW